MTERKVRRTGFRQITMKDLSPETVWHITDKELLSLISKGRFGCRPKRIRFYAPSFMYYRTSHYSSSPNDFPTISVTADSCALNCAHCGGKVLETMYPATTPEKLLELCKRLKLRGAQGCLISGGCLPDGSVPLGDFIETIGRIKRELGLTVLVHTGVTDFLMARALKESGVDSALIDVIGSDDTIRSVCRISATVQDYARSLKALNEAEINFVPHVIVGLHYGKLRGELQALEMISRFKPSALVIIAFMPIRDTPMQDVQPSKPIDITRVLLAARLMFPETPLVLGCMRPKGEHRKETDVLAIRVGVDAIAFPAEEAIEFAEDQRHNVSFSSLCCSQVYSDA
jgi:uncharacterized radical SAM superfamily protein